MIHISGPRCLAFLAARSVSVVALLIAVPPGWSASSEDWDFKFITTPEGVWVNEVVSLLEDDQGAIWAATWGEGLHKIDQTSWDSYTESTGFVGDWQNTLLRDENDALWVGTADGICRIVNGVPTTITTSNTPGLISHSANAMLIDTEGNLLVGTSDGYILRCPARELSQPHPGEWQVLAAPDVTGGATIIDLIEPEPGRLRASLKLRGMLQFDGATWQISDNGLAEGAYVFGRRRIGGDEIWAGHRYSAAPMLRWTHQGWVEEADSGGGVRCFAESDNGTLYIGTEHGLQRWVGNTLEDVDLGPEIGEPNIQALHIDRRGTIWLGCQEGLARGSLRSWTAVPDTELPHDVIALIGTLSATTPLHVLDSTLQLHRREGDAWVPGAPMDNTNLGAIKSTTFSRDGRFWVLDKRGETVAIDLSDGQASQRIHKPDELLSMSEPYMSLYLAPSGTLYLHSDAGVHQRNGGVWQLLAPADTTYSWAGVTGLAEAPNGSLHIAGYAGLISWDGNTVLDLGARVGIVPEDSAHAVCARRSGAVWYGTHGSGIYVIDGDAVRQITRKEGLRSDAISGVYEDSLGTVWVAYRRQGIGRFKNGRWLNYGFDHGLPNTAVTEVAEWPPGKLWARTANGKLYEYSPDPDPPETRIIAGPGRVDAHGIASFSFDGWDAWGHTLRNQLRFASRIVPAGQPEANVPWSPLLSNKTMVTDALPRGDYTFEVRAFDEDGNADPTPASIAFTVLPSPLARPLFLLPLMSATLIGIALIITRRRAYHRLKRSRAEIKSINRSLMKEIEERDGVEQALRRSESHLEQAQVLAKLGSWDLNPRTQVGTWSREMFSLFDRDPADGTPSFHSFLKTVHPDDRQNFIRKHRELFQTGEPFEAEFRSHPTLGAVRYFHNRVYALLDKNDEVRVFIGTTQDITAQKIADLQRGELEEKLRQAQKLEAIGQLVGGIAHDFNNILHALLGFCHMARRTKPDDREALNECLDGIDVAGNRAADLVRQLLTFSRREKIHRTVIQLEPVVVEALKLLRSTLPATIVIERTETAPEISVLADTTQLHQIVLNLCTNAAQAMEKCGGTLRIAIAKKTLTVATIVNTGELPAGDYVVLTVADTGPGIDADTLGRIFDPFFTTKKTVGGTGLGLTTVHGIVLAMDGGIAVSSTLGAGTAFEVYLKMSAESPAARRQSAPGVTKDVRADGMVLLVEDEVEIAIMTKKYLDRNGFEVDVYTHPEAALKAFSATPESYAIVVTDFTMPTLTGATLASLIREKQPSIPIVLLSGQPADNGPERELYSAVLLKPVNLNKLNQTIREQLAQQSPTPNT